MLEFELILKFGIRNAEFGIIFLQYRLSMQLKALNVFVFGYISNKENSNLFDLNIINNKINYNIITSLIDTGASIPVWTSGIESFIQLFPESIHENSETFITGFGRSFEISPAYRIPEFILSDGRDSIVYHDLPITVLDRDYSFDMIISFPMLAVTDFEYISHTPHKSAVPAHPQFRISHHKQEYLTAGRYIRRENIRSQDKRILFTAPKILENICVFFTKRSADRSYLNI